jgi:hypothetical protein
MGNEGGYRPRTVYVREHVRTLATGRQVLVTEHWRAPPRRKSAMLKLAA